MISFNIPRRAVLLPLCLTLGLTAASCSVKEEEFRALQAQVSQQQAEISRLNNEVSATSTEVTAVRPAQADLNAEINDLRVKMAELDGRMETVQRQIDMISTKDISQEEEIARLSDDMRRLKLAWQQAAAQLALDINVFDAQQDAGQTGNATVPADSGPINPEDAPDDEALAPQPGMPATGVAVADDIQKEQPDPAKGLYDSARSEFEKRNYAAAQTLWDEFARTFPKHELVPNAWFWQGESFYQQGDYNRAVLAYQQVIAGWPKSTKYKTALFKQGVSFVKLGKTGPGKLLLQDVIKKFPKSPEARRAKDFLKKVK